MVLLCVWWPLSELAHCFVNTRQPRMWCVHQTLRLCWKRVWVLANVFAERKKKKLCFMCDVPEPDCLPNLPSPLPKLLLNLVPNPQPRVQPNLLPRWRPSLHSRLQPSWQLDSPFQWPLLSMCSSSKSSTCARKSGPQCLSLSRPEHQYPSKRFPGFCGSYALVPACLASCLRFVVFPLRWGASFWLCHLTGVAILLCAAGYCSRGQGRFTNLINTPKMPIFQAPAAKLSVASPTSLPETHLDYCGR